MVKRTMLAAALLLGLAGCEDPPAAYVECKAVGATVDGGFVCSLSHKQGSHPVHACWRYGLMCLNGSRFTVDRCADVEPGSVTQVSVRANEFRNLNQCDQVLSGVVADVKVESPGYRPFNPATPIVALVVLLSSAWMAWDAKRLGYRKGDIPGGGSMSPTGWFVAGVLVWILAFPLYLFKRGAMKAAGKRRRQANKAAMKSGVVPPGYLEPPATGPVADLIATRAVGLLTKEEFEQRLKALADEG